MQLGRLDQMKLSVVVVWCFLLRLTVINSVLTQVGLTVVYIL